MPLIDVPPIHAVTDPRILTDPGFLARAESVFRALGTSGAVHVRGPGIDAARLFHVARLLAPLQDVTGCRLVVNDRADLAAATAAWGVQLGQRSMAPAEARLAAPRAAVGVSIHSLEEGAAAVAAAANWVFAGHVFETPSHREAPPRGLGLISSLAALPLPVIAIGGVRPGHVAGLREAGAHGIAAIRGIWDAPDSGAAARAYLQER